MRTVTSLSDAARGAELPDPSTELMLLSVLMLAWAKGRPERMDRLCGRMQTMLDTHSEMDGVLRVRGSEYDARVIASLASAAEYLRRMRPLLLFMATR